MYNLINLISQGCFRAEIIPFYSFGNANAEDIYKANFAPLSTFVFRGFL